MNALILIIAKFMIKIGKLINRGTTLPGALALKLNKDIFNYFKYPNLKIAITGSSGKGSSAYLIVKILEEQGKIVLNNSTGANITPGILTMLISSSKLNGKLKGDALVLEIDERYTKQIFKYIDINYLIITNVTRDQPPRQGHFDIVSSIIKEAITPTMHLILNGDDPYIYKVFKDCGKDKTYFSLEKNKYSYKQNQFANLNINYCPKCHTQLKYNYYNFEATGDYYCPNKDFKRPIIDVVGDMIDFEKNILEVDDTKYVLKSNILYAIYNTLGVITLTKLLNLNQNEVSSSIIKNSKPSYIEYIDGERKITILNNKNENSSTFNQSLLFLNHFSDEKVIVIGWKEISRRYNFDDLSWLYDIDFEILSKLKIEKIICIGIHRYDIALRIKYSNIEQDKILTFAHIGEAVEYIKTSTNSNIYGILNFDYVEPFKQKMQEGGNDDNNNSTSLL